MSRALALDYALGDPAQASPPYRPHPRQARFHASPRFEVLFGGATGPGKSRALCEDALEWFLRAPGARIVICRRTEAGLKQTTLQIFFDEVWAQIPRYWREKAAWRVGDLELRSWDVDSRRSVIRFSGVISSSGQANTDKIKSQSVSLVYEDEATEIPETLHLMWFTQLRYEVPHLPRCTIKGATNPEPGTWCADRFVIHPETGQPWTPEELHAVDRDFIPATWRDNPSLPPDYGERFELMPELFRRRFGQGDWSFFSGQAIPWSAELMVPFRPLDLDQYASWIYVDHGQVNPCSAHRYNLDARGAKVVDWEYYSPGGISEHARALRRVIESTPNLMGVVMDRSAFAKDTERDGEPWSIADEYQLRGVEVVPSAASGMSDLLKVQRLHSALAADPRRHNPFGPGPGRELYVMDNCIQMAREFSGLKWRDPVRERENAPERLVDRANHAFDECCYFLGDHGPDERFEIPDPRAFLALRPGDQTSGGGGVSYVD